MHWFLAAAVRFIRCLLDNATHGIFKLIYERNKESIPPIDDPLLLLPAVQLAKNIRSGKNTSVEIIEAFFRRIQDVNSTLNCVVDTRFDEALKEARAVDELISASDPDEIAKLAQEKPFLGVPFTTKDCFGVTGLSLTVGLKRRKGRKSDYDAETVKRMRNAGAIPIAVTNVSELCLWMESTNNVYGTTKNPYHTGRIVGGSSGGESCAIASGASVFGIGSDIGGSIRMPSYFCGIFGHKPTMSIVPNSGQLPVATGSMDTDLLTTGPMCRYASDLMPMFKVMAGPVNTTQLELNKPVNVRRLRVFYMEDDAGSPMTSPVHPELRESMHKLLKVLELDYGMEVRKVNIEDFSDSMDIWSHAMAAETAAPTMAQEMTDRTGAISPLKELLKWLCFRSSDHTLPAIGLALLETVITANHPDHKMFLRKRDRLRDKLNELLGEDGVFIYPTHPVPAPYHGQPLVNTFNWVYTAIFNATGHPATQVPLGIASEECVPLGVQIVSAHKRDRNSLALALEVEKNFGGWKPPTGTTMPYTYEGSKHEN